MTVVWKQGLKRRKKRTTRTIAAGCRTTRPSCASVRGGSRGRSVCITLFYNIINIFGHARLPFCVDFVAAMRKRLRREGLNRDIHSTRRMPRVLCAV